VKNISKCPHCQEPVQTKELQDHIEEMSGTYDEIKEAVLNAKFTKLKKMQ
jgi:transcription initiation factor IIE alpha subunit